MRITALAILFFLFIGAAIGASPVMNSVSIQPVSVYDNSTLIGFCNATDADGDNATYSYRWYNGTSLYSFGPVINSEYLEGFESNSLANWTITYGKNTQVTVNTTAAHSGTYGIKADTGLGGSPYNTFIASKKFPVANGTNVSYSVNIFKPATATYAVAFRLWIYDDNGEYYCIVHDDDSSHFGWATYGPGEVLTANTWYNRTIDVYSKWQTKYGHAPNWNRTSKNISVSLYTYADSGGQAGFYADNIRISGLLSQAVFYPGGSEYNIANLSGVFKAGENWTFSCQANDSTGVSEWMNSSQAAILNSTKITGVTVSAYPSSPISYGTNSTFSCYANESVPVTLYINGTNKTSENGTSILRNAGSYAINCSWTGNSTYSGNSTAMTYMISPRPVSVTANVFPASPIYFGLNSTFSCHANDSVPLTLYVNGTDMTGENGTSLLRNISTYLVNCSWPGNSTHAAGLSSEVFEIIAASGDVPGIIIVPSPEADLAFIALIFSIGAIILVKRD